MTPPVPRLEPTAIPGLVLVHLDVRGDQRGWFKENWQRAKLAALGLPDLGPVQHNVSYNVEAGVTRGLHAEPWDKYVGIGAGRVFAAWVDLREGPSFGTVVTRELDEGVAAFVPRGVANGYQTLVPDTSYTYLVNAHWSPEARYTFVNLADPTVAVPWPIPLTDAVLSDKDRTHPPLGQVTPFPRPRTLVLGTGQLGRALAASAAAHGRRVTLLGRDELDVTDAAAVAELDTTDVDTIVNAAAWTDVDGAEDPANRAAVWATNATAVAHLARLADERRLTLVHVSSDYVFDGTREIHDEDEPLSPLGVYGQSKAAGDLACATAARHYLLRTSWVVGEGRNFVRTMAALAERGVSPAVVSDQVGRLTFADDLARAVWHLLDVEAPYGTYDVSCAGPVRSWADIAAEVYRLTGHDPDMVRPVPAAEYFADKPGAAPRPAHSTLDLSRIERTGFVPADGDGALARYVAALG